MTNPELINVTVVPAQAGYKLVFVDPYSDDEIPTHIPDFWMDIVVAWRVETYKREDGTIYSYTDAVTVEGSRAQNYAILFPDGGVEEPYIARYPDMKAFLTAARETQAKARSHEQGTE